jgi:hypothetical protein
MKSGWPPALLLIIASPALAEPQLIVSISGPIATQLRPGTFVKDGKSITLGVKDHIVVVDSKGARGFSGPQTLSLARSPAQIAGSKDWINRLIDVPTPALRLAGVRKVTVLQPAGSNPFLDVVFPAKPSGSICFVSSSRLFVARVDRAAAMRDIKTTGRKILSSIMFENRASTARWPSLLVPVAGTKAQYSVIDPRGRIKPQSVTLVHVRDQGLSWLEFGQSLTRARCSNGEWLLAMRDWDENPKVITAL